MRVATGKLTVPQVNDKSAQFLPVAVSSVKPALSVSSSVTVELVSGHRITLDNADASMLKLLLASLV